MLTNVGLDHTEYLGETVEEISREKLASLAPGAVLILGTDDPRGSRPPGERCERGRRPPRRGRRPPEGTDPPAGLPPYAARNVRLGLRARRSCWDEPHRGSG